MKFVTSCLLVGLLGLAAFDLINRVDSLGAISINPDSRVDDLLHALPALQVLLFIGLAASWFDSLTTGLSSQLKWLTRLILVASIASIAWGYSSTQNAVFFALHGLCVLACLAVELQATDDYRSPRPWATFSLSIGLIVSVLAVLQHDRTENALRESRFAEKELTASETSNVSEPPTPAPPTTTQVTMDLRLATLRVTNRSASKEGSGVLISTDQSTSVVLTAAHLIDDLSDELILNQTHLPNSIAASVIAVDAKYDIALLQAPFFSGSDRALPIAAGTMIGVTPSISGGYENERFKPQRGAARQKSVQLPDAARTLELIEFDQPGAPGRSGGPLISLSGEVIGIASGINAGKSYFTPHQQIRNLLKNKDLESETANN